MVVSGKTGFIAQPRAAGASIEHAMVGRGGTVVGESRFDPWPRDLDNPTPVDALRVFTVIRNPFHTLVSAYVSQTEEREPWVPWLFETLLEERTTFDGEPLIRGGSMYWRALPHVDIVLKYHRLAKDLPKLIPGIKLTRRNVTRHRQFEKFFSEFQRQRVRKILARDFETFGWNFFGP